MTESITIVLDRGQREALAGEARRTGATVEEVVNRIVSEYLSGQSPDETDSAIPNQQAERSLADRLARFQFHGGTPHNVAKNHDEYLYPSSGSIK